ncbi:MAG: polysaccharide biosynthesis tyrosine autokinase [Actinomyces sp.]|uniref:polysaccharide biosynthesis tyrosine autokinase n=1 Tax=Actinomyces sp. TaxID=29317 RepID=UPI0026DB99C6|nr:polysaccharide biosynthesis tyrosine autokinase [Actinomyces sp.]MDO4243408.1 polysaccharide biosynthesis tyrosine autokinase [Actinomyces sp.]
MTLADLLLAARRRLGTLALGALAGALLGVAAVAVVPASYTASATSYVRVDVASQGADQAESYYAASQMANQKAEAFVPVFTSPTVARQVVEALGLEMSPAALAGSLSAAHTTDTLTITVSAGAASPDQARLVADEVIRQAAAEIERLEGQDSPVEVVSMSSAEASGVTRSPAPLRLVALGVLGGLVVAYTWVVARRSLDQTIRSGAEATSGAGAGVLALVPESAGLARGRGAAPADGLTEERLRMLRTALRPSHAGGGRGTLVVASARRAEGRTTLATGLARVMALAGHRVVLVEGDLRAPVLQEALALGGGPGLVELLTGRASLDQALAPTAVAGLEVLPAGSQVANPSELLGSTRMADLLSELSADRLVVIDSPPLEEVTDGVVLAGGRDTVLVARAGRTTRGQLLGAAAAVERGGGQVLGTVVNRVAPARRGRLKRRPTAA